MGKNKNKTNQQQYPKTDIDYDKLADAIVRANELTAERMAERERKVQEKAEAQWRKANHIDAEKQPKNFFQELGFVLRLPFIKKEKISDDRATFALERTVVCEILKLFQAAFAIIGIISVIGALNCFKFATWTYYNLFFVAVFVISWIMCGIFRMSVIEINKMQDRQMVLSILSAITSFIAMIIAIVALLV